MTGRDRDDPGTSVWRQPPARAAPVFADSGRPGEGAGKREPPGA
jgi:hypothetical protein